MFYNITRISLKKKIEFSIICGQKMKSQIKFKSIKIKS